MPWTRQMVNPNFNFFSAFFIELRQVDIYLSFFGFGLPKTEPPSSMCEDEGDVLLCSSYSISAVTISVNALLFSRSSSK